MSEKNLSQKICGICNSIEYETKIHAIEIENIPNFKLLKLQNDEQNYLHHETNASMNETILDTIKEGKPNT